MISKFFRLGPFPARGVSSQESWKLIFAYNLVSCNRGPYCGYEHNETSEKNPVFQNGWNVNFPNCSALICRLEAVREICSFFQRLIKFDRRFTRQWSINNGYNGVCNSWSHERCNGPLRYCSIFLRLIIRRS